MTAATQCRRRSPSIARRTGAKLAVVADESRLRELAELLAGTDCRAAAGEAALVEAAAGRAPTWSSPRSSAAPGCEPVMAAVEAGRTVALANKEALVTAGALMTDAAQRAARRCCRSTASITRFSSALPAAVPSDVARIILTASGGPFRTASAETMRAATPAQAVAHPNWSMGAKISVDSATLMNKGLELIEAHYLFGLPSAQIDIVIHPQSVIHSLVEFVDGSVLAQLGSPDMRIPIAYALAWPERMATPAQRLDLAAIARLDFEAPDLERVSRPCGSPARRSRRAARRRSSSTPPTKSRSQASLPARSRFPDIARIVRGGAQRRDYDAPRSIDDVLEIDRATRERARRHDEASCA